MKNQSDEQDFQKAISEAIIQLIRQPPITLVLQRPFLLILISHLQLALRHPANNGCCSESVRQFIDAMTDEFFTWSPALLWLICRGDGPRYDVLNMEIVAQPEGAQRTCRVWGCTDREA